MTQEIPVLTLPQPWASLVAEGHKRIETRSWTHSYRGPIAIHAAVTAASWIKLDEPSLMSERETIQAVLEAFELVEDGEWPSPVVWNDGIHLGDLMLPLGAIVAVAELVEIVPMVAAGSVVGPCILADQGEAWGWKLSPSLVGKVPWNNWTDLRDQVPFGDFAPGRYGWLLDNVRVIDPVPFKGGQGLSRKVDLELLAVPA